MPASLRYLDTDASTVITTEDLASILSPGSSSNKLLYVENTGDQTAQSVTVMIEAVGTNDGDDYALLAPDLGGSPGGFSTSPVSMGDLGAGDMQGFWLKVTLVAGLSAEGNTREFKLHAAGSTI
jgi:hypothetical protein